jgi:hypothetical protein
LVYNEKLLIDSLKPQFNIKKIVNRPYFDDEIRFIEEINRKIELKYFKIVDKQIEPIENYNILPF